MYSRNGNDMAKHIETYSSILCAETVDECSERVRRFLTEYKLNKRDVLRYAMSVEEVLLGALDMAADDGTPVTLTTSKRFFATTITLEIGGKAHNVYSDEDNGSALGKSVLRTLGLSPEYSYKDPNNIYSFRIRRKRFNPLVSLFISLVLAVAVSLLGFLLPGDIRTVILDSILTPLYDTFMNALSCLAGPMIFLSVAWGIYGIGDASTLKRIGKKLITRYTGTVFIVTALATVLLLPVFEMSFTASANGVTEASSIISMLLGIVPKDIFSPFTNGNTMQIIFLAIVIGIAMLMLGRKTDAVAKAVEQINYIVQLLIEAISKLVPYFIFVVLVRMIWSDDINTIMGVGKLFVVFIVAMLVLDAAAVCACAIKNKVNPSVLVRKGMPTLIVALSTASSAAAFGVNMSACRKRLGIDERICSFGIPLGMVTFKPSTAVNYVIVSMFFAEMFGVSVSVSWILITVITSFVLAIATPPIPGGAMTAYTVLFAQLGIPPAALAIALACDALFDFVLTGSDQFQLPMALLNEAQGLGLVDVDILKSKNN